MSPGYVVAVLLAVVALVLLRLLGVLPVRRAARTLGRAAGVVAFAGLLGLVLHCTAMFAPVLARAVPGVAGLVPVIDALGPVSVALFVVPALLLLGGIGRLHPVAVAVVTAALLGVGITMYDHGPLAAHLTAIAVAVVVLAVTGLGFVRSVGATRG